MSNSKSVNEWFVIELKERMEEADLRPYHLTTLCKMKEADVCHCLNGTMLPGLFSLVLLSEHLECMVNDLLGYDEVEETAVYEPYTASSMYFAESQYASCLSYRVRRYLEDRFMSISDLAEKTNISVSNLRRWFAKTRPVLPRTDKFLRICDALNCTPSELLGY